MLYGEPIAGCPGGVHWMPAGARHWLLWDSILWHLTVLCWNVSSERRTGVLGQPLECNMASHTLPAIDKGLISEFATAWPAVGMAAISA